MLPASCSGPNKISNWMAARYWWLGSLPLEPEHSNRLRGHGLLQLPQTECGGGLSPALSLCAHQRYGRTNGTYPKEITSVTKGNLRGSYTDVENPGTGRDDPGRSKIATEIATDLTDDSSVPPHLVATRRPRSEFVEGWLEIFVGGQILCCELSANSTSQNSLEFAVQGSLWRLFDVRHSSDAACSLYWYVSEGIRQESRWRDPACAQIHAAPGRR
jgi:hypothetical protein